MNFLERLQHTVGFTRTEATAILLLSSTFIAGLGIRWFQSAHQQEQQAPQFDYSKSDSAYAARAQFVQKDSLTTQSFSSPATTVRTVKQQALKPTPIVNINTGSKSELMKLPGIGATYAERIIEYRAGKGGFQTVDGLLNVKGIGKKKLEKRRPFVRVK